MICRFGNQEVNEMIIRISLTTLTILILNGCATTSVLILDESKQYPPSQFVAILNVQPSEPYIVIAQLETRGAVGTSLPQILSSMRDEAKTIGADAIIPTEDVSERQQMGLMYNPWLGGYQTLPGGKVPVIRGHAIKYKKNISSSAQMSYYKPKRDINFGVETLGLPYYDGFSGGTIWFGKDHFKLKGGKTSLATPSVYLRDGFENDNFDLTFVNIEYFWKNNYNGLWFGTGFGSWKGSLGHEEEIELGAYENVRLGFTFGYQYKLMNNIYVNGWFGLYALITGDTEAPVGNRIVYFDDGIPIISLDIGWFY